MAVEIKIATPERDLHDRIPELKIEKRRNWNMPANRRLVQFGFLFILLWIGVQFYIWVRALETGQTPAIMRPPGVEGFLPISALISLRYWMMTGVLNHIHPAGVVIMLIILGTGIFLKRAFCSWACPFGLISDLLYKVRGRFFRRRFRMPRALDFPLRGLKYLLLFFFVHSIFAKMSLYDLRAFVYSPYHRVADIKMLKFFTDMSALTFWVLVSLTFLSFLIPYFWCRYLCPYGALLGSLSWLSPLKIRRNEATCTDCNQCTLACPAGIPVHKKKTVFSDECNSCFECVGACPVKDTLYFSLSSGRFKLSKKILALSIIGFFAIGIGAARISGYWYNRVPPDEYKYDVKHLDDPEYFHNRSTVRSRDRGKYGVMPSAQTTGETDPRSTINDAGRSNGEKPRRKQDE